ncbi:MAG: hypothetical protein KBG28_02250 [Kofleriaceae bacterium]|jgi:hypothetical protein|nr:hypothetical protein [Kofleriaceae bacterium]MBP6838844.1 hypothetical protein [Kofleriaceae bacterium]MBP9202778.1 hypothetical protein [Kofleriaceae bacterium]
MKRLTLAVLAMLMTPSLAAVAVAAPGDPSEDTGGNQGPGPGDKPGLETDLRPVMRVAKEGEVLAAGEVSNIIFLNRCTGGCVLTATGGQSDARNNTSTIVAGAPGTQHTVSEFSRGDAQWQQLVECVREVYRPYNVMVTDVDPGSVLHHEAIVAGRVEEIGRTGALGVGTVSPTCAPYDNGISFSFANAHSNIEDLCWTVAQETAHTYGLSHAFDCHDPMTYLPGCGRKFFRNVTYDCGEFAAQQPACQCGVKQNSHVRLLDVFGPGTAPEPASVDIQSPLPGAVENRFAVLAAVGSTRGISRVELWLNGYKWAETEGRAFDSLTAVYQVTAPDNVPDGVIDVEIRAWDDLGMAYGSDVIQVTKGAPCSDAATDCAQGQQCGEGKCFWDPPVGELGDACEYDQYCIAGRCEGQCTEACFVGVTGDCPTGFACERIDGNNGLCFPSDGDGGGGGCCSVGGPGSTTGALAAQLGLGGLVLAGLLRRRRRT